MKFFDAHFHIIDYNYPIVENQGYLPPNYTLEDYYNDTKEYEKTGGAVISSSFHGFDQTYLLRTLERLGKHYYGVTQLPINVTDEEIISLKQKGVVAVRFNIQRGGIESLKHLRYFAERIYELVNWHTEIYVNGKTLTQITETLKALPKLSIDHLGLSKEGLPALLDLVHHGVRVKASGFSRTDLDIPEVMKQIYNAHPNALMFGTDLPSTRAPQHFSKQDIKVIQDTFDDTACRNIFYENAQRWYDKNK